MYLDPRRVDNPKTIRKISWENGFDRWFEKETTFRIFSVKNPWEPNSGTNFALAPCIVLTVFRKKFKMSKKYLWKSWRVLPRWWSRIYSVHRFLIKRKLNRLFSLSKNFEVWRFELSTSRWQSTIVYATRVFYHGSYHCATSSTKHILTLISDRT